MNRRMFLQSAALAAVAARGVAQDAKEKQPDGKTKTAPVLLHGGGELHPLIRERFIALGKSDNRFAQIVIVAATNEASKSREALIDTFKEHEHVADVAVLHAADAKQANDAAFIEPLTTATAIWFADADSPYDLRPLAGSELERALLAAHQRGAVIAGAGEGARICSRIVAQQSGDEVTFGRGFDLLPDIVIVPALMRENRWDTLFHATWRRPSSLGLGIDTETAVLIEGRRLSVLGESYVQAVRWNRTLKRPDVLSLPAEGDDVDLPELTQGRIKKLDTPQRKPARRKHAFSRPSDDVVKLLDAGVEAEARTGALVVHGGGNTPAIVWRTFTQLGGGEKGKLVTVPTASGNLADSTPAVKEDGTRPDFGSAVTLHTRDRAVADTAEFCRPIDQATALWFGGGLQHRIAEAYGTTRFERSLYALYDRGGVIGGTSAGAAIQSHVMITGTRVTPDGDEARIARGFDLLPGAIIDQHFMARNRWPRSFNAVSRHPERMGVCVDEQCAVVLRNGRLVVIGESYAHIIHASRSRPYPQVISLRAGDKPVKYDALRKGKIERVETK